MMLKEWNGKNIEANGYGYVVVVEKLKLKDKMNLDRIKEIQRETAYPESVSVQQALLKVWNECKQEQLRLHDVVGRSEQLLEEQSNWLMTNTSLAVEKIVDFKEHFK